jgi:formylglycine-generating enzyme required for sulfatase activity
MATPRLPPCVALALAAFLGCRDSGPPSLPPLGEALLIVDTDALVPELVGHLRVDAYAEDGTWYDSRDFRLPVQGDWPASFGAYSPDANLGRVATLRLRAYADGKLRDYRGERYQARPAAGAPSDPALPPDPPPDQGPRLHAADGSDITPPDEPEPLLTIDRLVRIRTTPGLVGSVRVVLRGACFGTMADVVGGRTCVDTENVLAVVTEETLTSDLASPPTSAGTFGASVPCTATPRQRGSAPDGTPLYDEEVCIDGGTYTFGAPPDEAPERIVTVAPFLIDKYEVTVGRWRDAMRHGLRAPLGGPQPNDAPLPTTLTFQSEYGVLFCSYTSQPMGRETLPVSCTPWDDARALCLHEGGDLPNEVQWEWVAAAAGRPDKTLYPWGGGSQDPTCDRAVFGRGLLGMGVPSECLSMGIGPLPVDHADQTSGDRSAGFNVVNLGASLSEWLADAYEPLSSICWMAQPLAATTCLDPKNVNRTQRGGDWIREGFRAVYGERQAVPHDAFATVLGFRCVRPASP